MLANRKKGLDARERRDMVVRIGRYFLEFACLVAITATAAGQDTKAISAGSSPDGRQGKEPTTNTTTPEPVGHDAPPSGSSDKGRLNIQPKKEKAPLWNSLEVVKLVVSALTPILVVFLAYLLSRLAADLTAAQSENLKHIEARLTAIQWANQKLIEQRLKVFDEVAPALNDLYCFMMFVGDWMLLTPPEMVKSKRTLDKTIHINAAIFSPAFNTFYHTFIHTCFKTFVGAGESAKLRADISGSRGDRTKLPSWQPVWQNDFVSSPTDVSSMDKVQISYKNLMDSFTQELGVVVVANSAARNGAAAPHDPIKGAQAK